MGSDKKNRLMWAVVGAVLAAGVLAWLTLSGSPPEPPDPGMLPETTSAPEEREIETHPTGPLERPAGTAPADPRRPAAVPYDERSEIPEDEQGESQRESAEEVAEVQRLAPVEQSEDEVEERGGEDRWEEIARRIREQREAREEESDAEGEQPWDRRGGGAREREEWADEEVHWEEESDEAIAHGEIAEYDEEFEGDHDEEFNGEYDEGEFGDGEVGDRGSDEEFLDDRMVESDDHGLEVDEFEEEIPEMGPDWRGEPHQEGIVANAPNGEPGVVSDATAMGEVGEEGERPPSGEALEDYQGYLDAAGAPTAQGADLYSSLATTHMADALYTLSAGRTLSPSEAARQRDGIVDAVVDQGFQDEEVDSGEVPPPQEGEPIDEFDEEWTVWLDAADWLRFIQEEDYPELAQLVDDVEEAAARLDAATPAEEQLQELRDFFEAVEIALEAMALEDEQLPWEG